MEMTPPNPTVKAPAERFTGDVYSTMIHEAREPSRLISSLVRFTPCARTFWHSHALGQMLHCSEGEGFVVSRDGTVITMRAGDTVWTPPGEEHWHGATDHTMLCHYSVVEGTAGGTGATWLEPVTEEQYRAAHDVRAS
jgi:quercetin dioxygenase-like cupin family protein